MWTVCRLKIFSQLFLLNLRFRWALCTEREAHLKAHTNTHIHTNRKYFTNGEFSSARCCTINRFDMKIRKKWNILPKSRRSTKALVLFLSLSIVGITLFSWNFLHGMNFFRSFVGVDEKTKAISWKSLPAKCNYLHKESVFIVFMLFVSIQLHTEIVAKWENCPVHGS